MKGRRRGTLYSYLPLGCALLWGSCGETPPAAKAPPAGLDAPTDAWTSDYDGALARAKREGKFVLADFTGSDWCPPCKRLKTEVFDTQVFRDWAARHAVLVEFDFPRRTPIDPKLAERNAAFAQVLRITGYPTVVLLDGEGRELGRLGYVNGGPEAWIADAESRLPRKGG